MDPASAPQAAPPPPAPLSKASRYAAVSAGLEEFFASPAYSAVGGLDLVARMATVASFLKHTFHEWVFCGFYCTREEGKWLSVGPYQGDVLATGASGGGGGGGGGVCVCVCVCVWGGGG